MKIKLIDFGVPEDRRPFRPHGNDAGADVYMPYDCTLQPGEIAKVPLGFGIEVPDGYAGYVFPRTSMAVKGLVCCFEAERTARHRQVGEYRKLKKAYLGSNSWVIVVVGLGISRGLQGKIKERQQKAVHCHGVPPRCSKLPLICRDALHPPG